MLADQSTFVLPIPGLVTYTVSDHPKQKGLDERETSHPAFHISGAGEYWLLPYRYMLSCYVMSAPS